MYDIIHDDIGSGSFATVIEARHKESRARFAVKMFEEAST